MKVKIVLGMLVGGVVYGQAGHTVGLTWKDDKNPTGTTYTIWRTVGLCSGSPTFSKVATGVSPKAYDDPNIQPGNYCYMVTANKDGLESAPSNLATAVVTPFAVVVDPPTIKEEDDGEC